MDPTFVSEQTVTLGEFLDWLERDRGPGKRELIGGRIVVNPPAGWPHGSIEVKLARMMQEHADRTSAGMVLGSSTGYVLPSGDLLEPDVSFLSRAKWEAGPQPRRGEMLRIVPDLVVEILSTNRTRDLVEKRALYQGAGVREYWLPDADASSVVVFRRDGAAFGGPETLGPGATLRTDLIPGFELLVGELFKLP